MNLFTRPMKLLTAVVLEGNTEEVVKSLLELGALDFVKIDQLPPQQMAKLTTRASSVSRAAMEDLRHRVEAVLRQGDTVLPAVEKLDVSQLASLDMDGYRRMLDELSSALLQLKDQQKESNQKLLGIEELERYIKEEKLQYIDLRVGAFEHGAAQDVQSRLAPIGGVVLEGDGADPSVVLTLRRDAARVNPLLDKFGWTESSDVHAQKAGLRRALVRLEADRLSVVKSRDDLQRQVVDMITRRKVDLTNIWCNLRLHELCDQIRSYFSYTRNTTLFSGWVPTDMSSPVEDAIRTASNGQCVIEWTDAGSLPREQVPVAVTSPRLLKPFQRMVDNYSVPEYGTINPTPFVAVAYLCMFALMFADAGQGAVLLLIGLLESWLYKKNPLRKEGMLTANVCNLLVYLGCASIVGGVLFGSYFGHPWFPAVWFNYHAVVEGGTSGSVQSIYDILGITIKFGIAIIGLGLILNWINLFRKKQWFTLCLDKNGLVGGWLFGVGVWAGFAFVASGYRSLPSSPFLKWGVGVPVVILLFKGIIGYVLERKEGGATKPIGSVVMDDIMEWLVDLLEIFSGFLANTLSFMRVAGLGIAHVSLMVAFADMADMVGGVGGIVVLVVGNALVIALEGLSAGIQSLRLNYYEFFTKYFTGKGIAYEPVGLRTEVRER
ncbi:MAG: V-type ATPase 116kDa subunit family protein [Sphaerochaetaceae bacterium]|nr:V-type ATPase 116kDa subunit family protein [Sphaerochaetaceae bacterium]